MSRLSKGVGIVLKGFVKYVKTKSSNRYATQIQKYTADRVKELSNSVTDDVHSAVQKVVNDTISDLPTHAKLDDSDVYLIFYELTTYHAAKISDIISKSLLN